LRLAVARAESERARAESVIAAIGESIIVQDLSCSLPVPDFSAAC